MTYTVVVTDTAEQDLQQIVNLLVQRYDSPNAAERIVRQFEELVSALAATPEAHALVRDEMLRLAGYRWSALSSYVAFFTIDERRHTVTIERVLHGRRNWGALLEA